MSPPPPSSTCQFTVAFHSTVEHPLCLLCWSPALVTGGGGCSMVGLMDQRFRNLRNPPPPTAFPTVANRLYSLHYLVATLSCEHPPPPGTPPRHSRPVSHQKKGAPSAT